MNTRKCLSRRQRLALAFATLFFPPCLTACSGESLAPGSEEEGSIDTEEQTLATTPGAGRIITADVVAIDQVYVYNRFGSFNPAGMIYALKRDVVPIDKNKPIGPGNAMLREDKRPRPLVLRANAGDKLVISFTNWLAPNRAQVPAPDKDPFHVPLPGNESPGDDSPATRNASIHVSGLHPLDIRSLGVNVGKNPNSLTAPGQTRIYAFLADQEGTFLMNSAGALSGGEGDGGQLVQGLFGAVHVEPPGSIWYRSQVTAEELAKASTGRNPDFTPRIDFEAVDAQGVPVLRMLDDAGRIVHSDLNAIITGFAFTRLTGAPSSVNERQFRELTILFHDEINAVQAFPELENDPSFQGVRDGFAINYGASGLGAELLANRRRIGPSRDCVECKFEDFFLTSWANGDPALNVSKDALGRAEEALYPDDPSNVHHSYLGDPVWIRNLHAGPAETHVFHVHGHQWLQTPNSDRSTYLDSQSIGPGIGFTYNINYGGGGNRNLTVGDALFHCHLYPHFAQGMWGIWRNHDVFEAGTKDRNLPDGEIKKGTPNPAVVPIPGRGLPPMPTYFPTPINVNGVWSLRPEMPGYPFYIAAKAGHRPSQPPLDIEFDGGLPRHLITSVPPNGALFGTRGQFDVEIFKANIKLLPQGGTPDEQRAMQFHSGDFPGAVPFTTLYGFPARAYPTFTAEGNASLFAVNGLPPTPGAPYAEPCPPSAPDRQYRVAFLQVDGTINKAGWHDPQMRVEVLEEDYEATRSNQRPLEPLAFRANSGECITFSLTNTIPSALAEDDFQIFTPTDIMGQHIHLVKFDVTSSDGASNGFNYEDGSLAPDEVISRIEAANARGGAFPADGKLDEVGLRLFLSPKLHPRLRNAPLGAQTTVQRWWADPLLDNAGDDRTIHAAFTHDHLSASSHQQHGFYGTLVVEPARSLWRNPVTGTFFPDIGRGDGGPTSVQADILTADLKSGFREHIVSVQDMFLAYDAFGRPVNPPNFQEAPLPIAVEHPPVRTPEVVSSRDPGTQIINYRNEPIPLRIAERRIDGKFVLKSGPEGEMHNVFRSDVHGDPATPIFRSYENDPIRLRLTQGSHEEQHIFSIHDHKWLNEVDDPDSGLVNHEIIGVSERRELAFTANESGTKNADGSVDHLYECAGTEDLWDGMWGLLRTYGKKVPNLVPLPQNQPPLSEQPMPICPIGAPERRYTVHAISARGNLPDNRLTYNKKFDLFDPDAILFVEESRLGATKIGRTEPLILRAAAGDCIKVTLRNDLPSPLPQPLPHWNYLTPITEKFNVNQVRISDRVSLHPQLVDYDVNEGDGAAIGRNRDQTVAPGQARTYTWYAGQMQRTPGGIVAQPIEYGALNLKDMADVVHHGMHGAIGTLIVEPLGAIWTTTAPDSAAQADVTHLDVTGKLTTFRESVLLYQDELGLRSNDPRFQCRNPSLNCGNAIRTYSDDDDAEDTGNKGFNYRTEPIWARLGLPPETPPEVINDFDLSNILSSKVFGDPETPIFTAKAGMPLRMRLLDPSGHRRQHSFSLWGHEWPDRPRPRGAASTVIGIDPLSQTIGALNAFGAMSHFDLLPYSGAGGAFRVEGDYLYRDQPSFLFTNGLWGILRVSKE